PYNIPNIRSEHSGEYTCQSRNEHGERRSIAAQINVQYPPKSVSVSISPPGKTVGGSSVNVTCSSDANPPVKNYTWFKEGGSSPVGFGDSYSPIQSGSYYCKAENKHGAQRSDLLPVDLKEGYSVILYGAAGVGLCVVAVFLCVVFWIRRKKQTRNMNEPDYVNEGHRTRCPDNSYRDVDSDENVAKADRSAPPCDNDSSGVNDYESITKAGLNTPPSDNGSSSADDYVNTPKAGLNAPPSDDDDDSSNDYVNTPGCIDLNTGFFYYNYTGFSFFSSLFDIDVMASLRTAFPLIFLLMIVGASGAKWSVTYNQQEICALKGSTVFMNGSYTLPEGLIVTEAFWTIEPVQGKGSTDLSKNRGYSGRVETLTDEQKHFSLRLRDVMKKDERQYCFRIITNEGQERWTGKPGVQLRVTDLRVEAPGEVTEGETAVLTCNTTCSLTDPTFLWYKNGQSLTTKAIKNNQLHLQNVSSEDAGSYSCAVKGYQHLNYTAQILRVRDSPKKVSVSISPSGAIVEGSSVTLTCSSNGNPPVKNYTWYKEGEASPVGSGHSFSITNITAEHTGRYYCAHGVQRSDAVLVSLEAGYSVILYVSAGVGLCVVVVFLSVFFWRRRRSQTTNTSEPCSANSAIGAPPPGDDSCSANIYMNVTDSKSMVFLQDSMSIISMQDSMSIISIQDDSLSDLSSNPNPNPVLQKAEVGAPPPDDDSCSASVYMNVTDSMSMDAYGHTGPPAVVKSLQEILLGILPGKASTKSDQVFDDQVSDLAYIQKLVQSMPNPVTAVIGAGGGASGTKWSVTYNQQEICALEGSTVFMNGSYTHPEGLTVLEMFWFIPPNDKTNLSKDPGYSGRVEYFTDEQKHFSLRLSDVMKKDEHHQFIFRIITNVERWMGKPGVQLRVTKLRVEAPGEVMEGGTAVLTCNTTCSLTDPTFICYKNGRPLTTKTIKKNQLHLQTVSSEDTGSYSCAVGGYQHLRFTDQTLRVRYPPKNVSVSISPSGEVVKGSLVNLTCSSDANPPVKNYTWYKEGGTSPVGSGDTYIPLQSGFYYCKAWNEHGDHRSDPNSAVGALPPDDGSCSANIYMNVSKGSLSAPSPDDDTTSVHDYKGIQSADLPDDDSSSDDDYQNITAWKNH
ncbi:hypothetical protein NFI96_006034, partial [Prochilodus magdalenae]